MRPLKILTLTYEFPPLGGGGSRVAEGLGRDLVRLGHEVDVVTMGFSRLPRFETTDGVNVYRVNSIRKRPDVCYSYEMVPYLIAAFYPIKQLIAKRKYDLNHTHFIFPDGGLSWVLNHLVGLPYVVTAHGSDVPGYNPDKFQFQHAVLAPFWKSVVKNARCIVCPSLHLQQLLLAGSTRAKTTIIPNGMQLKKFSPSRKKAMRVLVVSRMVERKGVQYLLKCLEGKRFDCEINIVGDGPYLPRLKRMAKNLDARIKFWGWLDNESAELRTLYESSTIFVLTSRQENFPVSLLEAMSAAMAIITSEDPGSREVVGDTALMVRRDQPAALFAALEKLSLDPSLCSRLGAMARKRVESNFAWPVVAERYAELFGEVVREHGAA